MAFSIQALIGEAIFAASRASPCKKVAHALEGHVNGWAWVFAVWGWAGGAAVFMQRQREAVAWATGTLAQPKRRQK